MSHFSVIAFSKHHGEDLDELLAQYNENLKVRPYICKTKADAIAEFRENVQMRYKDYQEYKKNPEEMENHYFSGYLANLPVSEQQMEWTDEQCFEHIKKQHLYGEHHDNAGNFWSTYNPKSKYDYYSETDGWDALILKDGTSAETAEVKDLDFKKCSAFAFVTTEGEWRERGEMGWFAMVANEKEKDVWIKEFQEYLAGLDEDVTAIALDCHI